MKNWKTTKEFLLNVPAPEKTKSYSPIKHELFINELQDEIIKQGYNIKEERYLSTGDGKVLTGNFILDADCEMSPAINFVNSYNKMRKASINTMALVLICKNGMMSNNTLGYYSRKHSGDVLEDIRLKMVDIVGSVKSEFEKFSKNKEEMKEIFLDKKDISNLVGDMFINEKLITVTQLGILDNEINFSKNFVDNSLWSFYNNVTMAYHDNHPLFYDRQHIKFHTYISDKFSLTGAKNLYN